MGGVDDVRIGDEPAAAIDEPAGTGLHEGGGLYDHGPGAAVESDLRVDPRRDERDRGLRPEDHLLDRQRRRRRGRRPRSHQGRAHEHAHRPWPLHG